MTSMLAFLCVLLFSSAIAAPGKGHRIHGGTAGRVAYVGILKHNGDLRCSVVLYKANYVITTAHCIHDKETPETFTVVLGDYDRSVVEGTEQTFNVLEMTYPPEYDPGHTIHQDDIAVLKLSGNATLNADVATIAIGEPSAPGSSCTISGWGVTEGGISDLLMSVDMTVISNTDCETAYNDVVGAAIGDSNVCLHEAGKDGCAGDSGAPMVCGDDHKLAGIVAWGMAGCTASHPLVLIKTSSFKTWIDSVAV